ncbi:hypothetical protein HY251_04535 [bacterium]|nr:hypothetical protein [bacterium]
MSSEPEIIRGDELTLDTFHAAAKTHIAADAHVAVDGKVFTKPELIAKADELRTPFKAKRAMKTQLKKASVELDSKRVEIRRFVIGLNIGLKAFLGNDNPEIVKFGFKVDKKHRSLTAEEADKRAKKALESRKRHHTMGRLQKKALDESASSAPDATPPPPAPETRGPTHVA